MIPEHIQGLAITALKDWDVVPILRDALFEIDKGEIATHFMNHDKNYNQCRFLKALATGKYTDTRTDFSISRNGERALKELESWLGPYNVE